MELSNTIPNFNYNNNTPLSNVKILEAVFRFMREDEEEAITDANNDTADTCRHASNSHRENSNAVFTSGKIEKSNNLVNAVNNMAINDVGYELNIATVSNAQVHLTSDPDTVTHTSNRILDQKVLICRTIGEVSVLPPPTNPRVSAIELVPQTLLTPEVQEIFTDAEVGSAWTNRTPRRISRTRVDGSIPISTLIHSGIRKTSTPYSSDSTGTRIYIGTSGTSTALSTE